MGVTDLDKQFAQLKRILTDDARTDYVEILTEARIRFMVEYDKEFNPEI